MIGVRCPERQVDAAREFFELFKTPWTPYRTGERYDAVLVSGDVDLDEVDAMVVVVFGSLVLGCDEILGLSPGARRLRVEVESVDGRLPLYGDLLTFTGEGPAPVCVANDGAAVALVGEQDGKRVIRCGYDLFDEIEFLLTEGQPPENALIPTLEVHIALLRRWIVEAGVELAEIPPIPAGFDFIACLTHDVDFLGIRRHKLDHTMWGFVYRASVGSLLAALSGRISWRQAARNWAALASLPLVHMRLADDFWLPFERYAEAEGDLRSTFFLVPFQGRKGEAVTGRRAARRAVPYDIDDARPWAEWLLERGCEIGLHGIDAWADEFRGRTERARIAQVTGNAEVGVRMHWLLFDEGSPRRLESAGFAYDSTCGYNDAVGFRAGTTQVFCPLSARRMLELPLHIQDTALFYPRRLHLRNEEAWERCLALIERASCSGGVLTISWHERSLSPERQWGGFYADLLTELRSRRVWIAPAGDVVRWFRARRAVPNEGVELDPAAVARATTGREPRLDVKVNRAAPQEQLVT